MWRIVVGVLLLVLGAFATLGFLVSLAGGTYESPESGAEALGALCGALCCIGIPVIGGIILLVLPPKR